MRKCRRRELASRVRSQIFFGHSAEVLANEALCRERVAREFAGAGGRYDALDQLATYSGDGDGHGGVLFAVCACIRAERESAWEIAYVANTRSAMTAPRKRQASPPVMQRWSNVSDSGMRV